MHQEKAIVDFTQKIKFSEPALYIVSTPIGNLDDISLRALQVLNSVDLIAAEDTRHSKKLLNHFNIRVPVQAYHEHSKEADAENLLNRLQSGQSVALITDAGTPLIADPGYKLVVKIRSAGFKVSPVPGASAMIAAISVAGLPTDRFCFEGFLPAKSQARKNMLQELSQEPRTMVFYEAPHRIIATLEDMLEALGGDRRVVIARELTKHYETILDGSLSTILKHAQDDETVSKGEIVLLVSGFAGIKETVELDVNRVLELLVRELTVKQAASLTAELTGKKKNALYQKALIIEEQRNED